MAALFRVPLVARYLLADLGGEAVEATIRITQEVRPPRDPTHGTADPMVWRQVRFDLPRGTAALEQTDYGHPRRFNPWEPRGITPALQPRLDDLRSAAERAIALLN